ncbi:hypothetical protein FJ970_30535 [Mesorhizobium sp. B2-1-8]|uniref:hypothetical protein n=1 Tax=Mesorhizobium sp. B2-1-8 TaxID=2589967 RepID=UPI001127E03D|nr:hypothetical protein [Mesorhizobium sp. B2-1-8]UCI19292.1 hypothetical protein FJ970_30535 [Mesorhizobium sp. B2-1-8]
MDPLSRFSNYDVFAYLPQGFMALAAIDYIFGTTVVLAADWDVPKGALVVFAAYIMGHVVAMPASTILERWIVHGWMKPPSYHLFQGGQKTFINYAFAEFSRPLAQSVKEDALARLDMFTVGREEGDVVFWKAYPLVKRDEKAAPRLEMFLNLYGFCRNAAFVSGLAGLVILAQYEWAARHSAPLPDQHFTVAILLLIAGFILFRRFLKFYMHYTREVFVTFAQIAPIPQSRPDTVR